MKNREKVILVVISAIVAIATITLWIWTPQNQTMADKSFNYKIVDVPNKSSYYGDLQIIVENLTDFNECVRFLQGLDAIVFRTTHQYGPGEYSTVYFFPYQGYLIMYAEPQG